MARHCEVNFFSLQPSMEYFGHDLSPKMKARLERKLAGRGKKGADEPFETGNPLLTSLGRLNRDFTELRLELDERAGFITREQPEQFVEPAGDDMLAVIQRDILHARNRGDGEHLQKNVAAGDRSIQIHACHSPMREVEVLYDQLLDLFQKDSSLKPHDIIVMTPDIEKYAPFIQAVFGFPEESGRYIPFSVTDRMPRNESPVVATFLSLLALPGCRCTATEIFSLLDRLPVRSRFKFTDSDMGLIRRWIVETGIRWGIDGAHRAEFGLPALEATTWRAGFQRLLLGYAMAGGNRTMFEGIMPYDDVEGSNTGVMGRFITAVEALFEMAAELPKERPLAEWPEVMGAITAQFFQAENPDEVADMRLIQTAIDQLREVAQLAGGAQMAGFRAVRHFLAQLLDVSEQRGGFFTGGVTFCALKPMRSIPARVICLIGMDDEAFPRRASSPGFDLMARESQCGDRSSRDDDRFSFLEAVISARGHFYASYLGRSIIDNGEVPPSVLVSELLDYMDKAFMFPGGKNARTFAVSEHRLHAFSRRYFDGSDSRLFSYSTANAAASRSMQTQHSAGIDFLSKPLPEPDEELRNVNLRSLIDFFTNPVRYFVRHRLGIRFDEEDDLLEDSEIFDLGNLEKYQLKQELVTHALEKYTASSGEFTARGLLPLGGVGEARLNTLGSAAVDFSRKLEMELNGQSLGEPLALDLRIGKFSLTGKIESIYGNNIVQFRFATLKAKDWLRAWINHLAKCASSQDPAGGTVLVGDNETVKFSPVKDASMLLANLLEIYWNGLRRPPHFFPASAFAYAEETLNPSSRGKTSPIDRARKKWDGGERANSNEKDDVYNEFYFAATEPLDGDFEKLALEIFGPALRHATQLT
jgi:exodeoxyribonuclease V gamma subunit